MYVEAVRLDKVGVAHRCGSAGRRVQNVPGRLALRADRPRVLPAKGGDPDVWMGYFVTLLRVCEPPRIWARDCSHALSAAESSALLIAITAMSRLGCN